MKQQLVQHVCEAHKDVAIPRRLPNSSTVITTWPPAAATLTSEEVENIKNLIQQQGRLEFRILANPTDDKDALKAAEDFCAMPTIRSSSARLEGLGEPPPPPRTEGGGLTFHVTLTGEDKEYAYQWVELGKEELYSARI